MVDYDKKWVKLEWCVAPGPRAQKFVIDKMETFLIPKDEEEEEQAAEDGEEGEAKPKMIAGVRMEERKVKTYILLENIFVVAHKYFCAAPGPEQAPGVRGVHERVDGGGGDRGRHRHRHQDRGPDGGIQVPVPGEGRQQGGGQLPQRVHRRDRGQVQETETHHRQVVTAGVEME